MAGIPHYITGWGGGGRLAGWSAATYTHRAQLGFGLDRGHTSCVMATIPSLGGAGEGGWRGWGWVRDRKGGKVTSYDWLGGGGGQSAGTYTHRVQFTLAFTASTPPALWLGLYSRVQFTVNCTREYS
jgi:hypothetical protein